MTIELASIDFSFGKSSRSKVQVLDSFSLVIEKAQVVAIVGPSGCGKSTILQLIAGLLQPSCGEVLIDGKPAAQVRRQGAIGFVFQAPALLPWRTVAKNVRLPLELQKRPSDGQAVRLALENVGLEEWGGRHPHELSGGMQQRAALARALVAEPEILLMDEPFSQLDELLRFDLLFRVQDHVMSRGTTVVLVTHDLSEAAIVADVIFVLPERPVNAAERVDVELARPRSLASTNETGFHESLAKVRTILERDRDQA